MTDFFLIARSIVFHFAHIYAYGIVTVKDLSRFQSTSVDGPFNCKFP